MSESSLQRRAPSRLRMLATLLVLLLVSATTVAAAPERTKGKKAVTSDPFSGLPFDSGEIVASDYAETAEAIDVWNYLTNGFNEGPASSDYDASTDTQIVHVRSGGDPLPALDGRTHRGYRRMQTEEQRQSLWDSENQSNHTRSQLGGWNEYESFHMSPEGERQFIVYSVRLDPNTPIPGSVLERNGVFWLSMVSQFKSILPNTSTLPSAGKPMFSVYEGYDGLQLRVLEGDSSRYVNIADVPRGVWLRIGLDVHWSSTGDGAYRWWGDLDGNATTDFKPLSEKRSNPTIVEGYEAAALNIGPYHGIPDVPSNGRDYANVEILRHGSDDPWGPPMTPKMTGLSFDYSGERARLELAWGLDEAPEQRVRSDVQFSIDGGAWFTEIESGLGVANVDGWFLQGVDGSWVDTDRTYAARVRWTSADGDSSPWSEPLVLPAES